MEHHVDIFTNYGIDLLDIVFGSKYNYDTIENLNHCCINIIIIGIILHLIRFYKVLV